VASAVASGLCPTTSICDIFPHVSKLKVFDHLQRRVIRLSDLLLLAAKSVVRIRDVLVGPGSRGLSGALF